MCGKTRREQSTGVKSYVKIVRFQQFSKSARINHDATSDQTTNLMQTTHVIEACRGNLRDMSFHCQFWVQKYAKITDDDTASLDVTESNLEWLVDALKSPDVQIYQQLWRMGRVSMWVARFVLLTPMTNTVEWFDNAGWHLRNYSSKHENAHWRYCKILLLPLKKIGEASEQTRLAEVTIASRRLCF